MSNYTVGLILVGVCIFLSVRAPQFATPVNIANVLEQVSMIGILAVGTTLLLVSGNFDLSVGGIVGLTGVVGAHAMNAFGFVPGILAMLSLGLLLGMLNGGLVVWLGVNSLIATLGSGLVFVGFALLFSANTPVVVASPEVVAFISTRMTGLSAPVVILVVVVAAGHWLLHFAVGGRQIYAVGTNQRAAVLAGIRVRTIQFIPFAINGLLCGVSSLVLLGLLGSGIPDAASSWALQVVAAVVVGGVSVAGGRGSVPAALIGVLLIGVINNGLNLLDFDAAWQNIATGGVLVIAVALDVGFRRRPRMGYALKASAGPSADVDVTAKSSASASPFLRPSRPAPLQSVQTDKEQQ